MIENVMKRVQEVGMTCAPISDRASTFGFNRWSKLAKKAGLRPIYGVEIAVTPSLNAKKPIFDHWTFFAKDDLRSINELLYLATNQFRYEPLLTYEQAMAVEGVIKIAGSRALLDKFQPQPDLFIGLSPSLSKGFVTEAKELGHAFARRFHQGAMKWGAHRKGNGLAASEIPALFDQRKSFLNRVGRACYYDLPWSIEVSWFDCRCYHEVIVFALGPLSARGLGGAFAQQAYL
jgi:hypothetical protein